MKAVNVLEEVLRELGEENILADGGHEAAASLPPGFRFHPTDEELIACYLASKVFGNPNSNNINNKSSHDRRSSSANSNNGIGPVVEIAEIDLNHCEPWDLPERAKMGEREWYFYSARDRKYPTGLRTNRATRAGYWKATGKDREVYASASAFAPTNYPNNNSRQLLLIGMKKTLVFYRGRAPRGIKTRWVMHEYRLDGPFSFPFPHSSKEEWVMCRIFYKLTEKKGSRCRNPSPCSSYILQDGEGGLVNHSGSPSSSDPAAGNNFFSSPLPPLPDRITPPLLPLHLPNPQLQQQAAELEHVDPSSSSLLSLQPDSNINLNTNQPFILLHHNQNHHLQQLLPDQLSSLLHHSPGFPGNWTNGKVLPLNNTNGYNANNLAHSSCSATHLPFDPSLTSPLPLCNEDNLLSSSYHTVITPAHIIITKLDQDIPTVRERGEDDEAR